MLDESARFRAPSSGPVAMSAARLEPWTSLSRRQRTPGEQKHALVPGAGHGPVVLLLPSIDEADHGLSVTAYEVRSQRDCCINMSDAFTAPPVRSDRPGALEAP